MKILISALILGIGLSACSKESSYRERLKGTWTINELQVTEGVDTTSSKYIIQNAGIYSFNKSGDGSLIESSDTTTSNRTFKWSVISNHKVILNFSASNTEEWTVLSNQASAQIWENTSSDNLQKGGLTATHTLYRKISLQKLK